LLKPFLICVAALLVSAQPCHAQDAPPPPEIVRAALVSETTGVTPGAKLHVGVLLEPKTGWHTYWQNPGDAGMVTSFAWELPNGFTASGIEWPMPQRLAEGPLVTYSYVNTVFLPVTITVPATLDAPDYTVKVRANWLVCNDICIPESTVLTLQLPVAAAAQDSPSASLFKTHAQQSPQPVAHPLRYSVDGTHMAVSLHDIGAGALRSAYFFPRAENFLNYASPQPLTGNDTLTLDITKPPPYPTSGLLAVMLQNGEQKNYDVTLTPLVASPSPSLPAVLLLAVLGGLILNLMPCVLPVLSLKALAIARKSGHEHAVVVRQGLAYTLGILVSFALVAGVLLALRQSGEAIGWGYQMQSPAFVGFLIFLLFLIGLSLSGLFHLPVLLGNMRIGQSSVGGSFLTGMLATAVATPCTAPFMASAVGIALTLPVPQSLLVFEALGFGLALPFLLISLFPALRHFIPRPGAWMQTFQTFLAFPMYGSVIWLIWVLALQTGAGGVVVALAAMLCMVFVIWMKSLFAHGSRTYRLLAALAIAAIAATALPALTHMEIDGSHAIDVMENSGVTTTAFSKQALAALRQSGKPVFIDATAAWCITCQLNARIAIHTPEVMESFKKHGVTLMIADWTRRNDDITEFLSGFGYKGVPLYVYYPAQGEPAVLPQLLTKDTIIRAITTKGDE
jgi:thiol:disulfide interchange protein/DsbC/DsbD-like thiol-disulfide interchange protein